MIIYTVLIGDYDELLPPRMQIKGDFVCFTDSKNVPKPWVKQSLPKIINDNRKLSRYPKILSHQFFGSARTLYIDANLEIIRNVHEIDFKSPITMFSHFQNRKSIYDEAEAVIKLKKDDVSVVRKQISKYEKEKVPFVPIPENRVIFRECDDEIIELENIWWHEVEKHSYRDQLSFFYAAFKTNIFPFIIQNDEGITRKKYFKRRKHKVS